ncbi:MAG: glycosyl hydrolase family 18 protein [Anaerolineae bacterium]|nr:glycosyl hydrolase family 18 protein [Anaerolineae bacterium]
MPESVTFRRGAWIGIEWAMEPHTSAEISAFATELQARRITDAYLYVSYLRADGEFNPTYDHARALTDQLRTLVPDIRLLAWVGIPIQIDGVNRLPNPAIRAQIAEFAAFIVAELGFDGIHLNAEMAENGDANYLALLAEIRAELPEGTFFSVTAHALRQTHPVTLTPYPVIAHHWTPEHWRAVAALVDQIALMVYDSGLPFPADYRRWAAYQVRESAALMAGSRAELVIGLPTSEEWTPSHQTQAETLFDGLYGLLEGLSALGESSSVTGIAIYPYWETTPDEWALLDNF